MQTTSVRAPRLTAIFVCFCLSSCASVGSIDSAAPVAKASTAPAPAIPDSVIQIPLHVDLRPLAAYADSQVPPGEDGDWTDTGRRVLGQELAAQTSWRRGPISIDASDDQIVVRTTVAYKARVGIGSSHKQFAECGWDEAEPTLKISLAAGLKPQADWSLKPDIDVPKSVIGADCELNGSRIYFSRLIAEKVHQRFTDMAAGFGSRLAEKLDFHAQGQAAWAAITRPYPLAGKDEAYLAMNPRSVTLSRLLADTDGNGVTIVLGLVAHPEIMTGTAPTPGAMPLPPLEKGDTDGLVRIVLPVQVTYATLNDSLSQKYVGKTLSVGGDPETIEQIKVYASSQDLVIAVSLSGKADGTVYLTGVPAYDDMTHTLYMDKLNYTLATRNVVADSAGWLLHSHLQEMLQSQARYDLSAKVAGLRETATQALNRSMGANAGLSGAITSIGPQTFVLTDTGITAYMVAVGKVTLSLN